MGQDYAPAASLGAQPPLRDRTAVLHPGRHAPLMRWNRPQILIDSVEITPCHHAVDWPGHDLQDGSDLWAKRFRHGELRTLAPRFRLRDSTSQSETAQGGEESTRRADEDAQSLTPRSCPWLELSGCHTAMASGMGIAPTVCDQGAPWATWWPVRFVCPQMSPGRPPIVPITCTAEARRRTRLLHAEARWPEGAPTRRGAWAGFGEHGGETCHLR
jgi:hypothetical protein